MKKFLFFLSIAFIAAAGLAYIDNVEYPFADVCAADIGEFCDEYEMDIGNCMFDNYEFLNEDCADSVYEWGGRKYNWDDRGFRDVPRYKRGEFINNNRAGFGNHVNTHVGDRG